MNTLRSSFLNKNLRGPCSFRHPKQFGPHKCPVYLWVTYSSKPAETLEKNVRIARTVFVSRQINADCKTV